MALVYLYGLSAPGSAEVRYIGKTVDLAKRLAQHLQPCNLQGMSHKECWLRALLRDGRLPVISALEMVEESVWPERERVLIAQYRAAGHRLTNSTVGGEGFVGYVFTPEDRAKMSASGRGRKMSPESIQKSVEGRRGKPATISPEGRERMRAGQKATQTPAARANRADALRGRTRPPEVMAPCRAASKGRVVSEETRRKLSESHQGVPHPHSEEARRNMAAAQRGKTASPATRQRIAEAATRRFADPEERRRASEAATRRHERERAARASMPDPPVL